MSEQDDEIPEELHTFEESFVVENLNEILSDKLNCHLPQPQLKINVVYLKKVLTKEQVPPPLIDVAYF